MPIDDRFAAEDRGVRLPIPLVINISTIIVGASYYSEAYGMLGVIPMSDAAGLPLTNGREHKVDNYWVELTLAGGARIPDMMLLKVGD